MRNDASFEKDYLSGKYGAIPIVGDLNFYNIKKLFKFRVDTIKILGVSCSRD